MTVFINKEIKNLKILRRITIVFLFFINIGIIGFYTYLFYDTYSERNLHQNFILYSGKTLFLLQVIILAVFLPIIVIIYRRISFTINQLNKLDSNFSNLYQAYCNCRKRFFSEVPKYIISKNGLIIINNVELKILKKNEYNKLTVKRINLGRFGKKCLVRIYQNEKKITSLSYERQYPEEVDLLINNIQIINENISISENK